MKIKMHTLSAGPNGVRLAGQEYDVPLPEAEALIAGRYAEAVASGPAPKPAPAAPPPKPQAETAAMPERGETATAPAPAVDKGAEFLAECQRRGISPTSRAGKALRKEMLAK